MLSRTMAHNVLVLGTVLGCLFLVFVVQHSGSPRAGSSSEAGEVAVLREKLAVADQMVEVLEAAAARQTKLLGDKFGKDLLSGAHNAARTEHKLKIFVYELPPDFNTNLLDPAIPRFYDCRTSMYGAEIIIHEQMLKSPFRTKNPEEADLFFVPLYTSCFRSIRVSVAARRLKDREGMLRGRGTSVEEDQFHFLFSALDYLKDDAPYWKRQNGRDHVFAFTHDFAACFTYHKEDTYKTERMQVMSSLQNAILLQYLGDLQSSCFQSRKDIVIPPLITNRMVLDGKGGLRTTPVANKHTTVYFRGKLQFNGDATRPGYSRGLRMLINRTFGGREGFSINEGHSRSYLAEMQDAKLCLAPPGYALWTPRLAENIMVGCVPLLVGDDVELPFEWLIDYRSFTVRVKEADVPRLEEIVNGISDDELEQKRVRLMDVWRRFTYNEPSQPGDAFDTIMQRLAARAAERQPVANYPFGFPSAE